MRIITEDWRVVTAIAMTLLVAVVEGHEAVARAVLELGFEPLDGR